jgi:hypothetical protein
MGCEHSAMQFDVNKTGKHNPKLIAQGKKLKNNERF